MSLLDILCGPRRSGRARHCKRCGGFHGGECMLSRTAHGTLCRPELVKRMEARHAARKATP